MPATARLAQLRAHLPHIDRPRATGAASEGLQVEYAAQCGVRLRMVPCRGAEFEVAEAGDPSAPLVLLAHGWPESWGSYRHQLTFLAARGYHAAAPSMRGYGFSPCPDHVEGYAVREAAADLAALVPALGHRTAALVGHDWGAVVVWHAALLHADVFSALFVMSVPLQLWARLDPAQREGMNTTYRKKFGEKYWYVNYHAERDGAVAAADMAADPRRAHLCFFQNWAQLGPSDIAAPAALGRDAPAAAGGALVRMVTPKRLPTWISDADRDFWLAQYRRSGFLGGLRYYCNLDRNFEQTAELVGRKVTQPAAFLAGSKDVVMLRAADYGIPNWEAHLRANVSDLRGVTIIPGASHWVQQECPSEVNAELGKFLASAFPPA